MMSNVAPNHATFSDPHADRCAIDGLTLEAQESHQDSHQQNHQESHQESHQEINADIDKDLHETARREAALRRLEATDRRRLAARLDSAIQEHGFALRYAPRLSAQIKAAEPATNRWSALPPRSAASPAPSLFCGAELIIGVQHRRRGVVPVESYLRSVKRAPLIASVIVEGLTEALAETAAWPAAWTLSVAAPPRLADLSALRQALAGVTPDQASRVAFMIDEAALIADGLDALDTLDALRGDGFGLTLDRFGGRFGSLALLRSLPFTGVKLDRSLLQGEPNQRQANRVFTEACIAIGHDFGLTVIAGGVETETDYTRLGRMGIDAVQGSWAGAAVNAATINHLLRTAPHAA
jgi:EAL domain-containing protein (putative c-di-GMP-specific phosphodiesterase class I)